MQILTTFGAAMPDSESGLPSDLARLIDGEMRDRKWSLRDAEEEVKVSRSALANILNGKNQPPTLDTLDKLATYFRLPLWRLIEMAGIDLGLTRSIDDTVQQLTSLVRRMPEIEPIVQYLLKLYPEDLRGVVAYLEAIDRQHSRDRGWSGEGAGPHQ